MTDREYTPLTQDVKVEFSGKLLLRKAVDLEETSVTLLRKEFSSNQQELFIRTAREAYSSGIVRRKAVVFIRSNSNAYPECK
jgi:hypothetical protein